MAEPRSNYCRFEIYPDSCPNWFEKLNALQIACYYISHNRAKAKNGKAKKLHIHVYVVFSTVKSLEQCKTYFAEVAANGKVLLGTDPKENLLYLSHVNRPEKEQYSFDEVKKIGMLPDYKDVVNDMIEAGCITLKDVLAFCWDRRIKDFGLLYVMTLYERPDIRRKIEKLSLAEQGILKQFLQSDYCLIEQYEETQLSKLNKLDAVCDFYSQQAALQMSEFE